LKNSIKEKNKKIKIVWTGFFWRIFFLILAVFLFYFFRIGWKVFNLEKLIHQEISSEENNNQKESTLIQAAKNIFKPDQKIIRGYERGRINILLLGMGGEGHSGKNLTDTIMLLSVNPQTHQTAFLSIPRDLLVYMKKEKITTKINAVYAYGIQNQKKTPAESLLPLKEIISDITGQEIDYYLALDFEGFEKIIADIGGVDVEVTDDIYDDRYPGPNFSYETFKLSKGFQHLDSQTALKYCRVRHISGGDFGRAARQQQVIASVKNKIFSTKTLLDIPKVEKIINDLGEHLKTDLKFEEIPAFISLAESANVYQASNKVLDAWSNDSLLASTHVSLGGVMAYALIPRSKNYSQIRELSKNIFDLKVIERKKEEIAKESSFVAILSPPFKNISRIDAVFDHWGYSKSKTATDKELYQLCTEKTFLMALSEKSQLFTLSDLADKIQAELLTDEKTRIAFREKFPNADLVVCLSENDADYFQSSLENESAESEELKNQSIIDQNGKVLFN